MTRRLSIFERLVAARLDDFEATGKRCDACWIWHGARDAKGYGRIKVDGKNRRVHIVSFELATGRKLRPGHTVEHTCKNTSCWRPSHFLELTRAENTARGNRANPRDPSKARAAKRPAPPTYIPAGQDAYVTDRMGCLTGVNAERLPAASIPETLRGQRGSVLVVDDAGPCDMCERGKCSGACGSARSKL